MNVQRSSINAAEVTIGARCSFGPRVMILTGTHETGTDGRRAGARIASPVVIGDGVWVGANVTVLPGVTIGSGALIAAGALLVDDCEPDALYAGAPAKKVRALTPIN